MNSLNICQKCIYDERVSLISFDENGICNYCHQIDKLKEEYGTGSERHNIPSNSKAYGGPVKIKEMNV